MAVGLGSLTNTLQGLDPNTLAQALQEEEQRRLAAQTAAATTQAQQAGSQYQQAAQAPPPDLGMAEAFIPALLGNIASVIGQNPQYAQQGQERIQQSRATLMKSRADNLQALRDVWAQKAEMAQRAGDLEAEATARQKQEQISKTFDLVKQNTDYAIEDEKRKKVQEDRIALEQERGRQDRMTNSARPLSSGSGYSGFDPAVVAKGIIDGFVPPDPAGFSRGQWGAIVTQARKLDPSYNVMKAGLDYRGLLKHVTTLNQSQQLKLRQSSQNALVTADYIEELIKVVEAAAPPRTPVTVLNKMQLNAIKNGAWGKDAADAATQLATQIAAWRLEMASVYSGGYAPQEQHLKQGAHLIDDNWAINRIRAGLQVGRRDTEIRLHAVNEVGTMGPSNPLVPGRIEASGSVNIGPTAMPYGVGAGSGEPDEPATVLMENPKGKRFLVAPGDVPASTARGWKRVSR